MLISYLLQLYSTQVHLSDTDLLIQLSVQKQLGAFPQNVILLFKGLPKSSVCFQVFEWALW